MTVSASVDMPPENSANIESLVFSPREDVSRSWLLPSLSPFFFPDQQSFKFFSSPSLCPLFFLIYQVSSP